MPGSVEVRRCTAADAVGMLVSDVVDVGVDAEYVRGAVERQEAGRTDFIIALDRVRLVGSAELTMDQPPELKNLSVDAAARGSGIGSAIVSEAERIVEDRGARAGSSRRRLVIGVGVENPRAAALYERLGYVRTGVVSTTTYEYADESGTTRTALETDEELVKEW